MKKDKFDAEAARAYFLSKDYVFVHSSGEIAIPMENGSPTFIYFHDTRLPWSFIHLMPLYNPLTGQLGKYRSSVVGQTLTNLNLKDKDNLHDFLKFYFPKQSHTVDEPHSSQISYICLGNTFFEYYRYTATCSLSSFLTDESHADLFYHNLVAFRKFLSNSGVERLWDEYSNEKKQLQTNIKQLESRVVSLTKDMHMHLKGLMDKNAQAAIL
jgi:hypothetical protein